LGRPEQRFGNFFVTDCPYVNVCLQNDCFPRVVILLAGGQ